MPWRRSWPHLNLGSDTCGMRFESRGRRRSLYHRRRAHCRRSCVDRRVRGWIGARHLKTIQGLTVGGRAGLGRWWRSGAAGGLAAQMIRYRDRRAPRASCVSVRCVLLERHLVGRLAGLIWSRRIGRAGLSAGYRERALQEMFGLGREDNWPQLGFKSRDQADLRLTASDVVPRHPKAIGVSQLALAVVFL